MGAPPLPADFRAAYEAGATQRELAGRYGVSRRTIASWCQRADVELRPPGARRVYDGKTLQDRSRQASRAARSRARGEDEWRPRRRVGQVAAEFDSEVAALHQAGATIPDIAAKLGVHKTTVQRSLVRTRTNSGEEN